MCDRNTPASGADGLDGICAIGNKSGEGCILSALGISAVSCWNDDHGRSAELIGSNINDVATCFHPGVTLPPSICIEANRPKFRAVFRVARHACFPSCCYPNVPEGFHNKQTATTTRRLGRNSRKLASPSGVPFDPHRLKERACCGCHLDQVLLHIDKLTAENGLMKRSSCKRVSFGQGGGVAVDDMNYPKNRAPNAYSPLSYSWLRGRQECL